MDSPFHSIYTISWHSESFREHVDVRDGVFACSKLQLTAQIEHFVLNDM